MTPQRYLTVLSLTSAVLWFAAAVALEWGASRAGAGLLPVQLAESQAARGKVIVFNEAIPNWGAFKVQRIKLEQPEVLLISSSRGNMFRQEMFSPYQFYNAALTAWSIDQTTALLEKALEVAKPRVLIFSLDYWMIGSDWPKAVAERTMHYTNPWSYKYETSLSFLKHMISNPKLIASPLWPLLRGDKVAVRDDFSFVGFEANRYAVGFRPDGSFLHPPTVRAVASDPDKNYKGRVVAAFTGGVSADPSQLDALRRLAQVAKQNGVTVFGLQLPVAPSAIHFLDTDAEYQPYAGLWRQSQSEEYKKMLAEIGIQFFNFSRLLRDNTDFLDAAHGNEVSMVKVVIELSKQQAFRATLPLIDVGKLQRDLSDVTDPEAASIYDVPKR